MLRFWLAGMTALEQTTARTKCGGPSTSQRTVGLSVASVGMTAWGRRAAVWMRSSGWDGGAMGGLGWGGFDEGVWGCGCGGGDCEESGGAAAGVLRKGSCDRVQ